MSRINWVRLIGGVIASVIPLWLLTESHEQVVNAYGKAVYSNLGVAEPKHTGIGVLYFAVFELGKGICRAVALCLDAAVVAF